MTALGMLCLPAAGFAPGASHNFMLRSPPLAAKGMGGDSEFKGMGAQRKKKVKKSANDLPDVDANGVWRPCADAAAMAGVEEGGSFVVEVEGTDKMLTIVRSSEGYHAIAASCGRCQFPLLNGEVVEDRIICPCCATPFGLNDGKPGKPVQEKKNLMQNVAGGLFSNLNAKFIGTFQLRPNEKTGGLSVQMPQ